MIVDDIIAAYGGAAALARRLHINRSTVLRWKRQQRIPADRVVEISLILGPEFPKERVRPDIYGGDAA